MTDIIETREFYGFDVDIWHDYEWCTVEWAIGDEPISVIRFDRFGRQETYHDAAGKKHITTRL